jgi:4-hydroxybenzoate polyprenyltransferase/phosphoserine phosphatase
MAVEANTLTAQTIPTPPLCIDLDGTLIRSDLLLESLVLLIKRNPLYVFLIPMWLFRGKAAFKAQVAARVTLNPAALPYDQEFLTWLKSERNTGRSLWLCTGANERLAATVASHLRLFDGVLASSDTLNLTGKAKATQLVGRFGERAFDYCGNERKDLAIWRHARAAIIVSGGVRLERDAARLAQIAKAFPPRSRPWRAAIRALRPHQWAKNALVMVPLFAAHRAADASSVAAALLALTAFCLCASSVYLLNDLLDLEADRAHPRKSKRPFAAGDLSLLFGLLVAPCLLGATVIIAAFLPAKFWLVLGTYYALTCAYSFFLKGIVLVDALALAGLYTLRIIAGSAAVAVPLSFWLLIFSVFLFLSLAFVKRFAELEALRRRQLLRTAGRGYHVEDLSILQSLGTAAGYLSVLVLALYINSPEIQALYSQPKVIWTLCVLMLYWISRVWMIAQRGLMHDDPVVFALKDRQSVGIGLLAVIAVVLAV